MCDAALAHCLTALRERCLLTLRVCVWSLSLSLSLVALGRIMYCWCVMIERRCGTMEVSESESVDTGGVRSCDVREKANNAMHEKRCVLRFRAAAARPPAQSLPRHTKQSRVTPRLTHDQDHARAVALSRSGLTTPAVAAPRRDRASPGKDGIEEEEEDDG